MKKNSSKKSYYKNKLLFRFILGFIYGFVIGWFFRTSFSDTISYGFLLSSFILSCFGLLDCIFWYFKDDLKNKRKVLNEKNTKKD